MTKLLIPLKNLNCWNSAIYLYCKHIRVFRVWCFIALLKMVRWDTNNCVSIGNDYQTVSKQVNVMLECSQSPWTRQQVENRLNRRSSLYGGWETTENLTYTQAVFQVKWYLVKCKWFSNWKWGITEEYPGKPHFWKRNLNTWNLLKHF